MKNTKPTSDPAKTLEFKRDAWKRFERAVRGVASTPPQHRPDKRNMHRFPPAAMAKLLAVPSDQARKILESLGAPIANYRERQPHDG